MNREPRTANCRYEQAVYGSFPFWDKGYALLAHSPGCLPAWLDAFRAACQRFGERPRGASEPFPGSVFSIRLDPARRLWLVVGVGTPGADDRGRPDALAFHGLFCTGREFRKVGYDPFALAGCLRTEWGPETDRLDAGVCAVAPREVAAPGDGSEASRVAALLRRGKRVAIESAAPIDDLARSVWAALPARTRKKAAVATWAYANDLRFDLLAAPRLSSLHLDASYVDPSAAGSIAPERHLPVKPVLLATAALVLTGVAVVEVRDWRPASPEAPAAPRPAPVAPPREPALAGPVDPIRGPDRASYRDDPEDPDEARAVERGLAAVGKRFLGLEPDAARGPTAWMMALAALRYEGRFLTGDELAAISRDATTGRSRALAWDAHVRRFAPDRPLPAGFAGGPLRWQLDTLAWSFHLELDPKLTASEIPASIAEALAVEEAVGPNPLAAKYPALVEYAKFLQDLPTR